MTSRLSRRVWLGAAVAVLLALTLALVAANVLRRDGRTTDDPDATAPVVPVVPVDDQPDGLLTPVRVDRAQHVRMAALQRPGVHRFLVTSVQPALFQVIRPAAGYTPAAAAADVQEGFLQDTPDVAALRRLESRATMIGGVPSSLGRSGEIWLDLQPGSYWAVDVNAPPVTAASFRRFTVSGTETGGGLGTGTVVTARPGGTWSDEPTSVPAQGDLRFVNRDSTNHVLGVARLKAGRTMADVEAYVAARRRGETPADPPLRDQQVLSTGVVGPGRSMTVDYDVRPGRYVLLCTWPDASDDGLPHAYTGMIRLLTVR